MQGTAGEVGFMNGRRRFTISNISCSLLAEVPTKNKVRIGTSRSKGRIVFAAAASDATASTVS